MAEEEAVKRPVWPLSAVSYKVGSGGGISPNQSAVTLTAPPGAGGPVRFGRLIYKRTAAVGTGEARESRAGV